MMKRNMATDANRHRLEDVPASSMAQPIPGQRSCLLSWLGAEHHAPSTHHVVVSPSSHSFISIATPPDKPQIAKNSAS